ncbi:DUF6088 family protein [Marinibaculum pumilum]|uniref:DUF6088 family protein n=1 Tax=Marinibaculum pumilum TaxID=1766165 RepID=A0ABV7KVJ4_9PROT
MKRDNLEARLWGRIRRMRRNVFLRADFTDLGGYDQVGRALNGLVRKGKLLRVGQGIYARAKTSKLSGKLVPVEGLGTLREALERVGIEPVPTQLERDYEAGRTTQVPTGRVVGVRTRVRRKIGYGSVQLGFERAEQAPR